MIFQNLVSQDESIADIDVDGRRFLKIRRGDIFESLEHLFVKYNEDASITTMRKFQ